MKMNNLTIKAGMLYRHSNLEPQNKEAQNEENRTFELSFSSEEPVERYFGIEILDHNPSSIKLDWLNSGRAPLLLNHDPTQQIGIVESASISSDGKARAKIRFSKNAPAESSYQDVLDGIKSNISVGYRYLQDGITLEREAKGNDPNVYRISNWEPLEISLVSIPADHTVGIGRNDYNLQPNQSEPQITQTIYQIRKNNMQTENINTNTGSESVTAVNQINTAQITQDIRDTEIVRVREILALGEKHNLRDVAMEFVREGKSLDNFRQKILENLSRSPAINTSSPETSIIGMSEKEARSFSILKAIKATVTGNWRGAELEREASSAVAKQLNREPASFFVPLDVTHQNQEYGREFKSGFSSRSLEKLVNTAGGYLVPTDYLASSFIEMLRSKMLVKQMGARVMSGLSGDIAIPKQTGGATAFWVSEGEAPAASQQSFGQITLSPKSIAAYTDFTRKLVLQASPDIEQLVRNDLATVIALELDRAAICGSGLGAEPLGVLNTPNIAKVEYDEADPIDWGKIVDLESSIASKNADIGTLGYLCNANLRGILKQTEKSEGTAQYLWENSGAETGFGYLNGYRVGTTNQMPSSTLLFGNFGDLIIGQWGVLDVLVDPYALGTSGGIRIRLMQDVDVAVRYAESFAVLGR